MPPACLHRSGARRAVTLAALATILVAGLWRPGAALEPVDLPLEHWAYEMLERFEVRAGLGRTGLDMRPLRRGQVAAVVRRIVQAGARGDWTPSRIERAQLDVLRQEFSAELAAQGDSVAVLQRAFHYWHGSGWEFQLDFTAGDDVRVAVEFGGKKHMTLVRERQRHPITGAYVHVDFQEVSMTEKLRTTVGILLVGQSPAVKDLDGVLVAQQENLEVECLPGDLPDHIEVDISVLKQIGDTIYIRDIQLSSSVEVLTDLNEVVVVVTPPQAEAIEEVVVEAAAPEPEVIQRVPGALRAPR